MLALSWTRDCHYIGPPRGVWRTSDPFVMHWDHTTVLFRVLTHVYYLINLRGPELMTRASASRMERVVPPSSQGPVTSQCPFPDSHCCSLGLALMCLQGTESTTPTARLANQKPFATFIIDSIPNSRDCSTCFEVLSIHVRLNKT
jgi:hypothetical protein